MEKPKEGGRATIHLLNASGFLFFFSWNLLVPLIPLYSHQIGFSGTEIGAFVAVMGVGPSLIAVMLGRWTDVLGARIILMAGGTLGLIAAGILIPGPTTFLTIFFAQFLAGLGGIMTWIASQASIARVSVGGRQRRILGAFTVYTAAGTMAGPLVAGFFLENFGYPVAFGIFGLASLARILVGLPLRLPSLDRQPTADVAEPNDDETTTALGLLRIPAIRVALTFSLVALASAGMRMSFFPLYLEGLSYSPTVIGSLLTLAAFSAVAVRPATAWLATRFGYARLIAVAMSASVLGVTVTPLFVSFLPLAFLIGVHGLGNGINQPVNLMILSEHTPPRVRGAVFGLRTGINETAAGLAPLLLGVATDRFGLAQAFFLVGFLVALIALYPMIRSRSLDVSPKSQLES